jgi:pimeloyl-ACP methyl ester carboxylesterase
MVRAGNVTLEIAETGAGGRPLLLVHRFTGAKEDFADWWDELAERGWHVVAPDLRGHGASDHPRRSDDYSLDTFEADLLALVDELGWDHFVLLGHSLGGMIAQVLTIHHPERVDALVLMDTVAYARPLQGRRGARTVVVNLVTRVFGTKAIVRSLRKPPPGSPESVKRLYAERPGYGESVERMALASSPVMMRTITADLGRRGDRIPELRSLEMPVLVIVGEHDMPGFVAESQRVADAIPRAELTVLADAAHSPQFETPDAWWTTLSRFLDSLTNTPSARHEVRESCVHDDDDGR